MALDTQKTEDFERVLETYSSSIRSSLARFGLDRRGIDPEDVLQDIRLKLWKRFMSEKKIRRRASYISVVVNSALADCLRRARRVDKVVGREKQRVLLETRAAPNNPAPDENIRRMLGEATDALLESRRAVVKLFLLDLSLDEITQSLGWSRNKTRNLLYRGIADIRKSLMDRGIGNGRR
jgi:RNA polymerase sigma-70 factor (ECF subfamily)